MPCGPTCLRHRVGSAPVTLGDLVVHEAEAVQPVGRVGCWSKAKQTDAEATVPFFLSVGRWRFNVVSAGPNVASRRHWLYWTLVRQEDCNA
jgi:hypothetical protein